MQKSMQIQLKAEELAMWGLSFGLFHFTDLSWWWYAGLFFAPDLGLVAYAIDARTGAFFYNLLHHKGVALLAFCLGAVLNQPVLTALGAVFFGHSAFDRVMGYGLKYPDSFHHTHLGYIGKVAKS